MAGLGGGWGELGTRWQIRRIVNTDAFIHALLRVRAHDLSQLLCMALIQAELRNGLL